MREDEGFAFSQELAEVLMIDSSVSRPSQMHHSIPDRIVHPPGGRTTPVAVHQGLRAFPPVGAAQAPDLPGGQP